MMKKSVFLVPVLILSILVLSACQMLPWFGVMRGSGNMTAESRQVSDFDEIRLDGAGRMVITQGATPSLEIEAEDNLINHLTSEVKEDTLVLGYQEQIWRRTIVPTRTIHYTLVVTDLSTLVLNGAGDIEIQSLETDTLYIEINGAGSILISDISAENLNITLSGTGSIHTSGMVSEQVINIDGAGNYQGAELQTETTTVKINGLGNSTVWASESLDVTIAGGGNVSYYGSPQVTQEISGLGQVRNLGEK